jgi:hypothetical protein
LTPIDPTKIPLHTASGIPIYIFDIKSGDIRLKDVATGLGNRCRWACQSKFFSDAQHSIIASQLVPQGLGLELPTLFHDCEEFIVGDMPTPVKHGLPSLAEYIEAGEVIRKIAFKEFDIPWPTAEQWAVIKGVDDRLAVTEALQLFEDPPQWALDRKDEAYPFLLFRLGPDAACEAFLKRFHELRGEKHGN